MDEAGRILPSARPAKWSFGAHVIQRYDSDPSVDEEVFFGRLAPNRGSGHFDTEMAIYSSPVA